MNKKVSGKEGSKGVKKALNSSNTITDKKEVLGTTPNRKGPRIPLSQQLKLSVPSGVKEEGFAYRFIRDKAERIEAFENAWWVPALDGAGRPIRKASGSGGYLLLYKIEKQYFEEDVKEKQKLPMNALTENAKLSKSDKYSSEYIPEGHEGVVVINN